MTWDYDAEVALDTPYLWWRLHESAGPTAADASGNARAGTYFGADITFALFGINNDDTAKAVRFNPSGATYDAGVVYNPVDGSFPTTDISIEFVGRDFTPGAGRTIVSYAEATQADEIRIVFSNVSGDVVFSINGASVTLNDANGSSRNIETNQHYLFTWRSSDGRVQWWLNGILCASGTVSSGATIAGAGSLVLAQDQDNVGGGFATADALRVTMCEFAVYGSVLSDARIREHAAAALTAYYTYEMLPGITLDPTDPDADVVDFVTSRKLDYFQRVWDAGLSTWCYYTQSIINPTPQASQTEPNYTGAISNHSVIRVFRSDG